MNLPGRHQLESIAHDVRAVRRLLPRLLDSGPLLGAHVVLGLGSIVVAAIIPLYVVYFAGQAREDGAIDAVGQAAGPVALVGILVQAAAVFRSYTRRIGQLRVSSRLRIELFQRIVAAPMGPILQRGPAYWQARIDRDLGQALVFQPYNLLPIGQQALTALVFFAVGAYLSWPLTVVLLIVLPISLLPNLWLVRLRRAERRASGELGAATSALVAETLRSLPLVKLSDAEDREVDQLRSRDAIVTRLGVALERRRIAVRTLQSLLRGLIPATIAAAGFMLGREGLVAIEDIAAFGVCCAGVLRGVQQTTSFTTSIGANAESVHRLLEVLAFEPELPAPASSSAAIIVRESPAIDSLRLEDVHFAYEHLPSPRRNERGEMVEPKPVAPVPVLHGVDLEIVRGEPAGLVGASGAGKSTVVALLCGLLTPTAGRILVDGRDLRELDVRQYRRRISAVLHQDFLLPRPLRDNLVYRSPERVPQEAVDSVLQTLDLGVVQVRDRERVERILQERREDPDFKEKFSMPDEVAVEAPLQVSAGERQRIAIARQLLYDSNAWLLDEATSNLDGRLEERFFERLLRRRGLLLFVVSHRLSCIERMEKVHLLQEGRIVASGSPNHLLQTNQQYRELFGPQIRTRSSAPALVARP
ncbi:MAG: ATP-binding cassette domain-containing protein [Planctomycetaceae bacterium]|nr:ATP-binding cassette domain-containing protein [Planctomycetaceae bacterium]